MRVRATIHEAVIYSSQNTSSMKRSDSLTGKPLAKLQGNFERRVKVVELKMNATHNALPAAMKEESIQWRN